MSITKRVEDYMLSHPLLADAAPLINNSALARRILKEEGLPKSAFDAIIASLRRLKLQRQEDVSYAVKRCRVRSEADISLAVLEKSTPERLISSWKEGRVYARSGNAQLMTILSEHDRKLKGHFREHLIELQTGLAELRISSDVPIGYMVPYILRLLSAHSVEIKESLSVWQEAVFIIPKKDLPKAIGALDI